MWVVDRDIPVLVTLTRTITGSCQMVPMNSLLPGTLCNHRPQLTPKSTDTLGSRGKIND